MTAHRQEKLIKFLKDKYSQGHYLGHEIVVAIIILIGQSQINQSDARKYLEEIFNGDIAAIYRSMKLAKEIVEPGMVEKILAEGGAS